MRRTLIIIQEDKRLRDEFEQLVKSDSAMSCIGVYASVSDALLRVDVDRPNMILLNIKLAGVSGIACLNFDGPSASTIKSFMATFCGNPCSGQELTSSANGQAAELNAQHQIVRPSLETDKNSFPTASSTVRMLLRCGNGDTRSKTKKGLSPREQQVFDLLATGMIYRKIANKLGIGEETVRCHVKQILRKLKVRNRMEAIAKYWQIRTLRTRITDPTVNIAISHSLRSMA